VVFIMADPVGSGVVASLAHPGGTMTGQSLAIEEQFAGKWLELLKEAAPKLSRVAFLWNPANHSSASSWKAMQGLSPTVGLTLQSVELRDPKDIGEALAEIIRDHRAEGLSSIRIPLPALTRRGSSSLPPQTTCQRSTSGSGMSIPVA
jgi:putative ABC transport system substrate-binding protein